MLKCILQARNEPLNNRIQLIFGQRRCVGEHRTIKRPILHGRKVHVFDKITCITEVDFCDFKCHLNRSLREGEEMQELGSGKF